MTGSTDLSRLAVDDPIAHTTNKLDQQVSGPMDHSLSKKKWRSSPTTPLSLAVLRLQSASGILALEQAFTGLLADDRGFSGSVVIGSRMAGSSIVAFGNTTGRDATVS